MPKIASSGGGAAPDAAASSAVTALHCCSPAHGSNANNNNIKNNNSSTSQIITPTATAAVLRGGYRNSNRLGLLALLAGASVFLVFWEETYVILGRKSRREGSGLPSWSIGRMLGTGKLTLASDKPRQPRVAVCFFGMARSLRWTLPSVQRRLMGVLKERGMEVETFVYTYDMREVRGWLMNGFVFFGVTYFCFTPHKNLARHPHRVPYLLCHSVIIILMGRDIYVLVGTDMYIRA